MLSSSISKDDEEAKKEKQARLGWRCLKKRQVKWTMVVLASEKKMQCIILESRRNFRLMTKEEKDQDGREAGWRGTNCAKGNAEGMRKSQRWARSFLSPRTDGRGRASKKEAQVRKRRASDHLSEGREKCHFFQPKAFFVLSRTVGITRCIPSIRRTGKRQIA